MQNALILITNFFIASCEYRISNKVKVRRNESFFFQESTWNYCKSRSRSCFNFCTNCTCFYVKQKYSFVQNTLLILHFCRDLGYQNMLNCPFFTKQKHVIIFFNWEWFSFQSSLDFVSTPIRTQDVKEFLKAYIPEKIIKINGSKPEKLSKEIKILYTLENIFFFLNI